MGFLPMTPSNSSRICHWYVTLLPLSEPNIELTTNHIFLKDFQFLSAVPIPHHFKGVLQATFPKTLAYGRLYFLCHVYDLVFPAQLYLKYVSRQHHHYDCESHPIHSKRYQYDLLFTQSINVQGDHHHHHLATTLSCHPVLTISWTCFMTSGTIDKK